MRSPPVGSLSVAHLKASRKPARRIAPMRQEHIAEWPTAAALSNLRRGAATECVGELRGSA